MLVSTEWLSRRLADPRVVVVDLRWREDGSGRGRYERGHIPGAVFLDWTTDLVDPDHPVAFMLAPPGRFARVMEAAGIGDGSTIVAYADDLGSGPHRLWWACRVYGHEDVHVLDGGLERWVAEGRPLSTEEPGRHPARWTPGRGRPLVATAEDVAEARDTGAVVLDARPPDQFRGETVWFETGAVPAGDDGVARTPRGPLRAGRVPWAASLPSAELYRADGAMKRPEELRELFAGAGAVPGRRVLTYCGVGISASAVLFALHVAGIQDAALYDASWEEWGRDATRPVARDPSPARGRPSAPQ